MERHFVIFLTLVLPLRLYGWSTTVEPPRAGLPALHLEAGHAGYVPDRIAPLKITVTGTSSRFDGYVGYHLAVGAQRTSDPSRIYHVTVPAGGTAEIDAELQQRRVNNAPVPPREIVVEWRNLDRAVIATRRAGVPPWSEPRTLRMTAPGDLVASRLLGEVAFPLPAGELPPHPRWYHGFSGVVASVDVWFSLPHGVREAILRSGVLTALFGTPSRAIAVTAADEAMLPVRFEGSPLRAIAKPGVHAAGGAQLELATSSDIAWASNENTLRDPLPGSAALVQRTWLQSPDTGSILFDAVLSNNVLRAAVAAALLSVFCWAWLRRRSSPYPVLLVVLAGIGCVLYRDSIETRIGSRTIETVSQLRPGVVSRSTRVESFGPGPLFYPAFDGLAASRTFGGSWVDDRLEVVIRNADGGETAVLAEEWGRLDREVETVEPGESLHVKLHDAQPHLLSFSFEAPAAVTDVLATWTSNGTMRAGTARISESRSGDVKIKPAPFEWTGIWRDFDGLPGPFDSHGRDWAHICVAGGTNEHRRFDCRAADLPGEGPFLPFYIQVRGQQDEEERVVGRFLLPSLPIPEATPVSISMSSLPMPVASSGLTLTGARGSLTLSDRSGRYRLSAEELHRVAPAGTIIRVSLAEPLPPRADAGWITLRAGGQT